jgi:hypothetical protein
MIDRHGASPAGEGSVAYGRRNFASADYEPTDADLIELSHEAFAGLREARDASMLRLREQIASARAESLAWLKVRRQKSGERR